MWPFATQSKEPRPRVCRTRMCINTGYCWSRERVRDKYPRPVDARGECWDDNYPHTQGPKMALHILGIYGRVSACEQQHVILRRGSVFARAKVWGRVRVAYECVTGCISQDSLFFLACVIDNTSALALGQLRVNTRSYIRASESDISSCRSETAD